MRAATFPLPLALSLVLFAAIPAHRAAAECPADASCAATGLDLVWTAPPGCPDADRVFADVERLSGRTIDKGGRPALGVAAIVEEHEGAWSVVLEVREDGGVPRSRRVEGSSCREVADAAAVIVALALDAPPEETPAPPPTPPTPAPIPAPKKPDPPRPPPPSPSPIRIGPRFALLGALDAAALPGVSAGGGLSAGLAIEGNRIEIRGLFFAPRDEPFAVPSTDVDAGASVALYAGALRYCRVLLDRPVVDLAGCGGVEVGALDARGHGFVTDESALGRWVAPELAFDVHLHLGAGFAIGLELAGLVPTIRDRFRVDGDLAYTTAPVDGRLALSVAFDTTIAR